MMDFKCATRLAIGGAAAVFVISAMSANATIIQVASLAGMTQGPYTFEDFEDDTFVSGITFSASSGVRRMSGSFPHTGSFGLTTNSFPDPISLVLDLGSPASSVGLWFGNDDLCCSTGFTAFLDIFDSSGLIDAISVVANMNDINDQFLGFVSDESVTGVSLRYGSGSDVGLFFGIDDVQFNVIPEPSTALLLASGLVAMAVSRRRRARRI